MEKVEDLSHADIGNGLVDDLLDLDWCDADVQGRADHHAVFAQRLGSNERGQLHH